MLKRKRPRSTRRTADQIGTARATKHSTREVSSSQKKSGALEVGLMRDALRVVRALRGRFLIDLRVLAGVEVPGRTG